MDTIGKEIDMLSLEITALGLELGGLTPEQKNELGKSLASITQPRLVVRRDAKFRITPLKKAQPEQRQGPLSPEITQPAPPTLSHKEIGYRLQRAAQDGELDIEVVARFYSRPEAALKLIPFDVRQKYNLPESLNVQKSGSTQDEPLSRGEIRARLLRAVQCGKLEPQFLGMFAAHSDRALQAIPYDIRKSFGLPETESHTLRKSQPAKR